MSSVSLPFYLKRIEQPVCTPYTVSTLQSGAALLRQVRQVPLNHLVCVSAENLPLHLNRQTAEHHPPQLLARIPHGQIGTVHDPISTRPLYKVLNHPEMNRGQRHLAIDIGVAVHDRDDPVGMVPVPAGRGKHPT